MTNAFDLPPHPVFGNTPPVPVQEAPNTAPKRGRKKAAPAKAPKKTRARAAPAQAPTQEAAPRKQRKARQPRPIQLDFEAAVAFRNLAEDDIKFVRGVVQAMQAFGAAQRRRIAAAIGCLFPTK